MSKRYNEAKDSYAFSLQTPEILDQLNVILYGPPGTGKTYNTAKYAIKILDKKEVDGEKAWELLKKKLEVDKDKGEDQRVEFITFHQSYSYEEFVEGLRPKTNNSGQNNDENSKETTNNLQAENKDSTEYEIRPGILKRIAERAEDAWVAWKSTNQNSKNGDKAPAYVLIIDEINRGDISRIFGELITLIEKDKRLGQLCGIRVKLPYSGELFGLPPNLYIIGTMNTADRSIALIDIALRRRFEFKEFMTDYDELKKQKRTLGYDIDLSMMLEKMNNRIEFLRDRDHTLGHSYFLEVKNIEGLIEVFRNRIIPLLQEYFFDDWRKIDMVLGEQSESGLNEKILDKKGLEINKLFTGKNSQELDNDKKLYQVKLPKGDLSKLSNKEEWAKAFKRIYE